MKSLTAKIKRSPDLRTYYSGTKLSPHTHNTAFFRQVTYIYIILFFFLPFVIKWLLCVCVSLLPSTAGNQKSFAAHWTWGWVQGPSLSLCRKGCFQGTKDVTSGLHYEDLQHTKLLREVCVRLKAEKWSNKTTRACLCQGFSIYLHLMDPWRYSSGEVAPCRSLAHDCWVAQTNLYFSQTQSVLPNKPPAPAVHDPQIEIQRFSLHFHTFSSNLSSPQRFPVTTFCSLYLKVSIF